MTQAIQRSDSSELPLLYETMLRIRRFEEAVAERVEAGEVRTPCHFCIGQEAAAAGVCAALSREDYIFGAHRSHGHYLAKGGDLRQLMAEIYCRETGCSRGRGGSMHLCAPEIGLLGTVPIVAATIPLAVGAAMASQLRRDNRVAVSFFGDGATEEGHFHESLNLASVRRLPVLFVCENNLYSSHMGLLERRRADNIPESGAAHGVASASVDGNDVLAVRKATATAVERARAGDGPTLLELRTFRWRGHVGPAWDYDVGVKRRDELTEWLARDPIARASAALQLLGVGVSSLEALHEQVDAEVEAAIDFARQSSSPAATGAVDHVYWNGSLGEAA
jgi:acetoin:2,6-dichlorophenolindophenol oxidoreductase subunit alpha